MAREAADSCGAAGTAATTKAGVEFGNPRVDGDPVSKRDEPATALVLPSGAGTSRTEGLRVSRRCDPGDGSARVPAAVVLAAPAPASVADGVAALSTSTVVGSVVVVAVAVAAVEAVMAAGRLIIGFMTAGTTTSSPSLRLSGLRGGALCKGRQQQQA